MRTCDFCGKRKDCETFSKKQLCGREREDYYVQAGIEQKMKIRYTKGELLRKEFKELEKKHQFKRKTRICKDCIIKFQELKKKGVDKP